MTSVEDYWYFPLDVSLVTSCVTRVNRTKWLDKDRVRLSYRNIEFELLDVDIIKFIILYPRICDTGRTKYNKLDRIEIFFFNVPAKINNRSFAFKRMDVSDLFLYNTTFSFRSDFNWEWFSFKHVWSLLINKKSQNQRNSSLKSKKLIYIAWKSCHLSRFPSDCLLKLFIILLFILSVFNRMVHH